MQHCLRTMIGYSIKATDGELGKVHEFYFDDATWTMRYMVVQTGSWLSYERRVLISTHSLGKPDPASRTFSVNLTSLQVQKSPDIDTDRPVHRQHEVELARYYQWPYYWEGGYGGTLGVSAFPLFEGPLPQTVPDSGHHDDPRLCSTRQVGGYHIHAVDGDIGHVADFIVDDQDWTIPYLVVDTGDWLPGKKVLISPRSITGVDWATTSAYVDRTRGSIENSPEFDPAKTTPGDVAAVR